jgi:hypothetical protein
MINFSNNFNRNFEIFFKILKFVVIFRQNVIKIRRIMANLIHRKKFKKENTQNLILKFHRFIQQKNGRVTQFLRIF